VVFARQHSPNVIPAGGGCGGGGGGGGGLQYTIIKCHKRRLRFGAASA